ncbi:MAG: GntR family transcriptional regulator [Dictyoglomaceae bacterium]
MGEIIDRKKPIPLHIQIKEYLKKKILSGELKPLERIPSDDKFARSLGVSPTILEYALQELVKEKLAFRIKGKGTFVSEKLERIDIEKGKYIGFIAPILRDYMEAEIMSGLESFISQRGYSLIYANSNGSYEKELIIIKRFIEQEVKGLVIYPSDEMCSRGNAPIRHFKEVNIPIVLVDRFLPGSFLDFVVSDNKNGAYSAVKYLIDQGHRNIAFITTNNLKTTSVRERLEGYKDALKENGIEVNEDYIFSKLPGYFDIFYEENVNLIKNFLKERKEISAIFTVNDRVASAVYRAIKELGLKVGKDISVVGFDNSPISLHLDPLLTSVHQEKSEMGRKAGEILISKIENNISDTYQVYLKTRLVIRDSVNKKSS